MDSAETNPPDDDAVAAAREPGPPQVTLLKEEPWVRVETIATAGGVLLRKTYRTPRHLLWRTLFRRSRAQREFDNLTALHQARVPCVRAVQWSRQRRIGCVQSCVVVTEFVGDAPHLGQRLAKVEPTQRRRLAVEYGQLLRGLHTAGFCSTTVSPRNVLVPEAGPLQLCDQPHLTTSDGSVQSRWRGDVDLFDAFFSQHRREQWSSVERLRGVLAYYGGDRRAVRGAWRRLARRRRAIHDLRKGAVRLFGRSAKPGDHPAATTGIPGAAAAGFPRATNPGVQATR